MRAAAEDGVRSLVLTGDADQFCSGADLKELEDLEFTRALRAMLDDLAGLAVPTIAAISGACMGLGMQLALACDLRLATDDARFAVPVAKLGLMVDHWTVQRLALLAGHSTARWMVMTARPLTAERAHAVGLVHELVPVAADGPGAAVLGAADELAGQIAALAPLSLAGTKLGLDLLERDVRGGRSRRRLPGGVPRGVGLRRPGRGTTSVRRAPVAGVRGTLIGLAGPAAQRAMSRWVPVSSSPVSDMTVQMTERSARAQDSSLGHHTAMSSSEIVQRTPTKASKRS